MKKSAKYTAKHTRKNTRRKNKMIIKNDAREIEKELNLDEGSCSHGADFTFEATKYGRPVTIITIPTEETQEHITILSVHYE